MQRLVAAVIFFAAALVGCATPQGISAGPKPSPEMAAKAVNKYLNQTLKDPESLKQLLIYPSFEMSWFRGLLNGGGYDAGHVVCFQYNAKNSYGAYAGVKNDAIVLSWPSGREDLEPSIMQNVNWTIVGKRC